MRIFGQVLVRLGLASFVFATTTLVPTWLNEHVARAATPARYEARGIVRSFGPGRSYAMIAHEKIEGFMGAMTMSFDAKSPEQLESLREGDRVEFTFVAGDDGSRRLEQIRKIR